MPAPIRVNLDEGGSLGRAFAAPQWIRDLGPGALEGFELWKKRFRNEGTLAAHMVEVNKLSRWCIKNEIGASSLTADTVRRFLNQAYEDSKRRAKAVSTLRYLFEHLVAEGVLNDNPLPKTTKGGGISAGTVDIAPNQTQTLLESFELRKASDLRDHVFIRLLDETGATLDEVLHLQANDLDVQARTIRLTGVDGITQARNVPVSLDLVAVIQQLIEQSSGGMRREMRPLVPTTVCMGYEFGNTSYGSKEAGRMIRRRFRAAGLPETLTARSFRNARIRRWIDEGIELPEVQRRAGHYHLSTTQRYLSPHTDVESSNQALRAAMDRMRTAVRET